MSRISVFVLLFFLSCSLTGCMSSNSNEKKNSDAAVKEVVLEHNRVVDTTEPSVEPKLEPVSEPPPEPKSEPSPEPKLEPVPEPEPVVEVIPKDGGVGDVLPERKPDKVTPPGPCKNFELDGATSDAFAQGKVWIGGVKVCHYGTSNCKVTFKGASGFLMKNLPLNTDFYLSEAILKVESSLLVVV